MKFALMNTVCDKTGNTCWRVPMTTVTNVCYKSPTRCLCLSISCRNLASISSRWWTSRCSRHTSLEVERKKPIYVLLQQMTRET